MTAAEVVDATGFTRRSVDRILRELEAGGAVRENFRGRRPSVYRREDTD